LLKAIYPHREIGGDFCVYVGSSPTGSYCRWQEVIFTQFAEFTLTIEDAQEYVYSISPTKRVRGWRDIEVKLYI